MHISAFVLEIAQYSAYDPKLSKLDGLGGLLGGEEGKRKEKKRGGGR